jgi:hypothetical protein
MTARMSAAMKTDDLGTLERFPALHSLDFCGFGQKNR